MEMIGMRSLPLKLMKDIGGDSNMKKKYSAPVAEKMEFDYEENVVASDTTPVATEYQFSGNPWINDTGNGNNSQGCIKRNRC